MSCGRQLETSLWFIINWKLPVRPKLKCQEFSSQLEAWLIMLQCKTWVCATIGCFGARHGYVQHGCCCTYPCLAPKHPCRTYPCLAQSITFCSTVKGRYHYRFYQWHFPISYAFVELPNMWIMNILNSHSHPLYKGKSCCKILPINTLVSLS